MEVGNLTNKIVCNSHLHAVPVSEVDTSFLTQCNRGFFMACQKFLLPLPR